MGVLFNSVLAANGFDSIGHYTRQQPLVGSCTGFAVQFNLTCSARFTHPGPAADVANIASAAPTQPKPTAAQSRGGQGDRSGRPACRQQRFRRTPLGDACEPPALPGGEQLMRRYRRDQGTLGNPVLIGALTVLVTIVAVTLAYQANNGLPFVPRYNLHVQIADASELTHGGEVHMGGALVGTVSSVNPGRDAAGRPIAILNLKLNKNVEPLPVDSAFDVRLKGAIGLKFLQITPGTSTQTWPDGATVPLGHAHAEVDLDQVFGMFNATDAHRHSAVDDRLQQRGGGQRSRSQRRDRGVRPAAGQPACRSPATSRRRTPTSAASSAGSSHSRVRSLRWRRRRPTCT